MKASAYLYQHEIDEIADSYPEGFPNGVAIYTKEKLEAHANESVKGLAELIVNDEIGLSAITMISYFTGVGDDENEKCHPFDASDFRRCVLVLRHMPQWRERLQELSVLSPTWDRLVFAWNELEATLEKELGQHLICSGYPKAPLTDDLLHKVLYKK